MRSAPSVTYPVGRSPFSARLRLALWSAGAAATAGWVVTQQVDAIRISAAVSALAACAAWGIGSWRREPAGLLAWDGSRWTFSASGREDQGNLRSALDLQSVLLVRWRGVRAGWLWLDRRADPRSWDAVRRAVHSPAFADPGTGAVPPGATP